MPEETERTSSGDIITLLFSLFGASAAELAGLKDRLETWLLAKGFVFPADPENLEAADVPDWSAFRAKIYQILGVCAAYGFSLMLYSMILGSSTNNPKTFWWKFAVGMALYFVAWAVLVFRAFWRISSGICFALMGISALFAVVALDNQLGLISQLQPNKIGVVHSMTGDLTAADFKDGRTILELEVIARSWALFGFFASVLMLTPFVFMGSATHALLAVLFGAPGRAAELITKAFGGHHEDSVNQDLEELTNYAKPQLTRMHLWVLGLGLMSFSLVVSPTFYGLMFAVLVGLTTLLTQSSRIGFGATGHELSRWVHAATTAICLGSIALYLIFVAINCFRMGPVVTIVCGLLAFGLFAFLPKLVSTTVFRKEREELLRLPKVKPYEVEVKEVDEDTGRAKKFKVAEPKKPAPQPQPQPQAAAVVPAAAPANHSAPEPAHGGGHGHGTSGHQEAISPSGTSGPVANLALIFCSVIGVMALGLLGFTLFSAYQSPTVKAQGQSWVAQAAAILPKSQPEVKQYEFELNASTLKQELPITISSGDKVESWVEGEICASVAVPCVGPDGQGGKPMGIVEGSDNWIKYQVGQFPVRSARFQSAVAYLGDSSFEIGAHKAEWPIPAGATNLQPQVGYNIKQKFAASATGGGKIKIKITKGGS